MKKVLSLVIVISLLCCLFACANKGNDSFVSIAATDLLTEDFGIAVKKGNEKVLNAVNAVIDKWLEEGKIEAYTEYYDKLAAFGEGQIDVAPDAGDLKTTWDFGKATEELIMYTESGFAPYEFVYNNNIVGVDAAIMSEVAVSLGLRLVIKDVAFDTIPTMVQQSTVDCAGAAGLSITDDRREVVDFSNVYSSSTLVVVSSKDKSYDSVSDLAGIKVGVQEGTSGDLIISDAISSKGYQYVDYDENDEEITKTVKINSKEEKIVRYKQYALAFADLKAGRIDAILMDKLPAEAMLRGIN